MLDRFGWLRSLTRSLAGARWGIAASLLALVVLLALFRGREVDGPGDSDGHYSWLYARSIVFDHDIDFTNDYRLCGDPHAQAVDRGQGRPDNPFYAGPAVFWVPALWYERATVPLLESEPEAVRAGCTGALATRVLLLGPLLGAWTVWIMYRISRRFADDGPAALAAGLLGLCTQLPAYAALMPSYSHVYDAFCAALVVWGSLRASERPRSILRWALVGVFLGVDVLQRPVSIVYGIVPFVAAIEVLWRDKTRLLGALLVLGACTFAFGPLPQMLIYKYLYGAYWAGAPHGRYYVQLTHSHPWLVLFAPHGGLFYSAPVVWIGVAGLVFGLRARRTRWLSIALLVAVALATWVSGAALDWDSSGTLGARRLTSALPLIAVPAAIFLQRASRWLRARPRRATLALGAAVFVPVAFDVFGYTFGLGNEVTTDAGMSQADLYGTGDKVAWAYVDEHFGSLAIGPAEYLFHRLYGHVDFRDVTEPLYSRNYRTMEWEQRDVDLRKNDHHTLVTGFAPADDGMHLVGRRGTVVFSAQWPFATKLAARMSASEGARVRIGRGRLFATTWYGDVNVPAKDTTVPLSIPPGGFDSGIIEIVVEREDAGGGDVVLQSLHFDDTTAYAPPLETVGRPRVRP